MKSKLKSKCGGKLQKLQNWHKSEASLAGLGLTHLSTMAVVPLGSQPWENTSSSFTDSGIFFALCADAQVDFGTT